MQKNIKILLCFSMFLMLFGCRQETEVVRPSEEEIEQKKESNIVSDYGTIEIKELEPFYTPSEKTKSGTSMWNNPTVPEAYNRYRKFAVKFLQASIDKEENNFISPLSFYYAMAILANGASGNTRAEIETALEMNVQDLNYFLKDLDINSADYDIPNYNKANVLLFNTNYGLKLKDAFKEVIMEYYGDSIEEYDFGSGKGLADKINNWVKGNTNGNIDSLVRDDDFDETTAFLILNALSFRSEWSIPFETSNTFYEEFHNYDNSTSLVEMMHESMTGYWSDDKSQGFSKWTMNGHNLMAIVPNLNVDIYDYINQMNGDTFRNYGYTDFTDMDFSEENGCLADLHITNLSFPKFSYEKEYDLKETLIRMGLKNLFDYKNCDFSAMAEGDKTLIDELCVDKARQKCSIEVNEKEVIASAVTAVMGGYGGDGCAVRNYIYHDVIFDRPFLFAIQDNEYDRPLFIGVVAKLGEPIEKAIQIKNITGKINIRSLPSTQGEKLGTFEKDKIIYAFETKEAEGYTWYRIGTDKWVADKNGEWIKVLG